MPLNSISHFLSHSASSNHSSAFCLYEPAFSRDLMEVESHSICPFVSDVFYVVLSLFYFWLRWVLVAVLGLSLVVMSGGYSSLWRSGFSCGGFSCFGAQDLQKRAQQLWHMGSIAPRHGGSSPRRDRTRVPALAGRLLTTDHQGGKSLAYFM